MEKLCNKHLRNTKTVRFINTNVSVSDRGHPVYFEIIFFITYSFHNDFHDIGLYRTVFKNTYKSTKSFYFLDLDSQVKETKKREIKHVTNKLINEELSKLALIFKYLHNG